MSKKDPTQIISDVMRAEITRTHALLSASSSERWLNCTPSAKLEDNLNITDTSSPFAQEGTQAHELGELYIRYKLGKVEKFVVNLKNKEVPIEMQNYASEYCDYVMSIENADFIEVEQQLDLSRYIPDGFGTCDAFVLAGDTLHIIDFKYGMGVKVNAYKNTQLMIYALGVIEEYKFLSTPTNIKLHIYQPRIDNISTYELETKELTEWAQNELIPKASVAYKGLGEKHVGSWCKFCKIKNQCRSRFTNYLDLINKFKEKKDGIKKY